MGDYSELSKELYDGKIGDLNKPIKEIEVRFEHCHM